MYIPLRRIPRYDDPRESTWGIVRVDTERCDGCGICLRACASSALVLDGEKARMKTEGVVQCLACGDCTAICPRHAIELEQSYRFSHAYETLERGPLRLPRL